MDINNLPKHVVQSKAWGEFKETTGKMVLDVPPIQFSLHKIPLVPYYVGYAPKINQIKAIDWKKLKKVAQDNNCVLIRFDCPNIVAKSPDASTSINILNKHCQKSPRNTFSKNTAFVDLTKSEEQLMADMKSKTRYNVRLARRRGVKVYASKKDAALEEFIALQRRTADRQGFKIHSDEYYRSAFKTLRKENMAHILLARVEKKGKKPETAGAWMIFNYQKVLYYPYGASDYRFRRTMASSLLMWEAMRLGKSLGCNLFDLWGVADDPEDKADPWYGFTRFKLGFGAEVVSFIDSYDLVLRPSLYKAFNFSYGLFWKALDIKDKLQNKFGK